MTLGEAVDTAGRAHRESAAERDAIVELLAPIVLGSANLLAAAIELAWIRHDGEIREVLTDYLAERAEIANRHEGGS